MHSLVLREAGPCINHSARYPAKVIASLVHVSLLGRRYSGLVVTDGLQIPHAIHMNVFLCRYEYVVNIPNSMTILPEMMPMALVMAQRKLTGWYHWQQKWQCSAAAVPQ